MSHNKFLRMVGVAASLHPRAGASPAGMDRFLKMGIVTSRGGRGEEEGRGCLHRPGVGPGALSLTHVGLGEESKPSAARVRGCRGPIHRALGGAYVPGAYPPTPRFPRPGFVRVQQKSVGESVSLHGRAGTTACRINLHSTAVALVMVVSLLAFTLSACGQPHPSVTQGAASSMTYHMARVTPQAQTTGQVKAAPVRLTIPAIGVNAPIERVGITSTGDLAVPAQKPWEDAGWYVSGPLPGELGSAVIDGHLDRPGGYPAVFWRLRDLRVGNEVVVVDTQGEARHFRVTAIAYYSPQSAPIQEIFANESGKYLNLITCAGDWIPSQHQTTLRLVVYTSLE